MGLFSSIRKKEKMLKGVNEYFKLMNAYTPAFHTFEGGIYEMELTRAAIHSFANHCSKLEPIIKGSGNGNLEYILQHRPNPIMDTKKYLYRLATVLSVDNTAFIAPLYDDKLNVVGFYPLMTEKCSIVTGKDGKKYVRYDFGGGNFGACELENIGILTQFQYKDELFGESNGCLRPTMELINVQNQGIINGVKNSASIRFLGKLAMTLHDDDIEKERKRFTQANLESDNNGGVLLFDSKYEEVKPIDSKPFIVSPAQVTQIKENVFNYFGTNEKILQNNFTAEEWNAYYEGKIEPFAIELSLVHTHMTFSRHETKGYSNEILFTGNRLQHMNDQTKLNMVTQLFDRGFISHNEGLAIFNMPPIEGGDERYIRREYVRSEYLAEAVLGMKYGDATETPAATPVPIPEENPYDPNPKEDDKNVNGKRA